LWSTSIIANGDDTVHFHARLHNLTGGLVVKTNSAL